MRVLFVTPSEVSSGEAVTALHMASEVRRAGGEARFLASRFTARLTGGPVDELGSDLAQNHDIWGRTLEEVRPEAIVFADYPLLFLANGTVPLATDAWVSELDRAAPLLVTLDHLGYAQGPRTVFFGPPHLTFHAAAFPALPETMQVLLPCPSHDPARTPTWRGVPFRYWNPPDLGHDEVVRRRYGVEIGDLFVLHATPQWAWRMAERFGLPYYRVLPSLLEHYLGDLAVPVTVLSLNNGSLLPPVPGQKVRIVNLASLAADDYERLLLSCDLLLSENAISVSVGKAMCAQVPCALLHNSFGLAELLERADPVVRRILLEMEAERLGSVFPYEVFPLWRRDEMPLPTPAAGCATIEVFGGDTARQALHRLLLDDECRAQLRATQRAYAGRVAALPGPVEALRASLALAQR